MRMVCKKSPKQETSLGNRGRLKVLNDTKLVLNEQEWPINNLGSICYQSEPSDVPFSWNQVLGWDFLAVSYKGHLISECLFGFFKFSKKNTERFDKFLPKNQKGVELIKIKTISNTSIIYIWLYGLFKVLKTFVLWFNDFLDS